MVCVKVDLRLQLTHEIRPLWRSAGKRTKENGTASLKKNSSISSYFSPIGNELGISAKREKHFHQEKESSIFKFFLIFSAPFTRRLPSDFLSQIPTRMSREIEINLYIYINKILSEWFEIRDAKLLWCCCAVFLPVLAESETLGITPENPSRSFRNP